MTRLLALSLPGTAFAHEFEILHLHFNPEVLLVAVLLLAWAVVRLK